MESLDGLVEGDIGKDGGAEVGEDYNVPISASAPKFCVKELPSKIVLKESNDDSAEVGGKCASSKTEEPCGDFKPAALSEPFRGTGGKGLGRWDQESLEAEEADAGAFGSQPHVGIPSGLKTSECISSPHSKIIPELDGDLDEELSVPKLIRVQPAFESIAPGSPAMIQGSSMMMQFSPFGINFRFASPPRSLTVSQVFESANKHMDQASLTGGGSSGVTSSGFKRSFNVEFDMSTSPPHKK